MRRLCARSMLEDLVRVRLTMSCLNGSRYKPLFTLYFYVETYIIKEKFIPKTTQILQNEKRGPFSRSKNWKRKMR